MALSSQSQALDGTGPDLREVLAAALPKHFSCQLRYVHTPPKPCEPLFSPPPVEDPERTRLASHFLTISVPLPPSERPALVFAMEVLVYTTKTLTTLFVSKADSTGYLPHQRPSPVRVVATTFIKWLSDRLRRPRKRLVVSLFARAQPQYLFPGSADSGRKHLLDDRQLIKWWARVLDPLCKVTASESDDTKAANRKWLGYMTVPGYNGMAELRSFLPLDNGSTDETRRWNHGNPLRELATTRNVAETAPTRCLLPRFPDDPKARFVQDLDDEVGLSEDAVNASPSKRKQGRWKSINDLDRFWEAMEFRQECSSGRVVGFLWLVEQEDQVSSKHSIETTKSSRSISASESQETQEYQPSQPLHESQELTHRNTNPQKRRAHLSGPVIPRQPRLKGGSSNISAISEPSFGANPANANGPMLTSEGYDCAMQTLLQLDFSTIEEAARSTTKWVSEVSGMAGLTEAGWGSTIYGTADVPERSGAEQSEGHAVPTTNDLGVLVRKKKRRLEGDGDAVAEIVPTPAVNMLVGRKETES